MTFWFLKHSTSGPLYFLSAKIASYFFALCVSAISASGSCETIGPVISAESFFVTKSFELNWFIGGCDFYLFIPFFLTLAV